MQIQQDNKILNSFLLFLDNRILTNGVAYTNNSGNLYASTGRMNNVNIYSTPYKQLVNDISISGANIMSGVFIGNTFVQPGTSGLISININEGQAYFTTTPQNVSAQYAVKDFSIYMTNKPEEVILFETKYTLNRTPFKPESGLPQEAETYPVIYLKYFTSENKPFCLGGTENKEMTIRAVVIGNNQFMTDAVCSILKDLGREYFKIIEPSDMPFDAYGGFTGVNYNYTGLAANATNSSLIWRVRHSNLANTNQFNKLNPNIFPAFVDFDIWTVI